ncbi:MAG: hypothetical protein KAZ85_00305 [Gammaproteobacteria bacterium]|nr:hypothetical protein [Gammaproteobacteria bacterium]
MKSMIRVCVEFDWRGDSLNYQAELELPVYMNNLEDMLHSLPTQIARQNGLDLDSIQYEWMLSNPIQVIDFRSDIECTLVALPIDAEDFLLLYQTLSIQGYLQKIAHDYALDLQAHPHLAQALKAAYTLGREQH